jgi:uncharacterized protein
MTTPASDISEEVQNFNWLVARFVQETAGVTAAIAVSSDGLLVAMSAALERATADRLAAIASAILSLAHGVTDCYPLGEPDKAVIELTQGYLLVCTISDGCALGVLASKQAKLGGVAFEMALFANRASTVLTPSLIEELKVTVGG